MNPVENILAKLARRKADAALIVDQSDCCGGQIRGAIEDPVCSVCNEHCATQVDQSLGSVDA